MREEGQRDEAFLYFTDHSSGSRGQRAQGKLHVDSISLDTVKSAGWMCLHRKELISRGQAHNLFQAEWAHELTLSFQRESSSAAQAGEEPDPEARLNHLLE